MKEKNISTKVEIFGVLEHDSRKSGVRKGEEVGVSKGAGATRCEMVSRDGQGSDKYWEKNVFLIYRIRKICIKHRRAPLSQEGHSLGWTRGARGTPCMLWKGGGERGWARVGCDGEDCVRSNKKVRISCFFFSVQWRASILRMLGAILFARNRGEPISSFQALPSRGHVCTLLLVLQEQTPSLGNVM